MNTSQSATYCGFVSVVGATNAGKSTLINRLVGHKVSIVSRKVQTTRNRILGIVQEAQHQIILIDTPGIFRTKTRLDRAMVDVAWRSIPDAELVLHVVDCTSGMGEHEKAIHRVLQRKNIRSFLLLNKVDLIKKEKLLQLIALFQQEKTYREVFLISAIQGKGLDALLSKLKKQLPPSPFFYDQDQISDLPERLLAAEIVREHLFDRLHQELPYALSVVPESWQERKDGTVEVALCIHVQKSGHKGIVIGRGGSTLKSIGIAARKQLERVLENKVHLELFVKVNPKWQDDQRLYQLWGLDYHAN